MTRRSSLNDDVAVLDTREINESLRAGIVRKTSRELVGPFIGLFFTKLTKLTKLYCPYVAPDPSATFRLSRTNKRDVGAIVNF